MGQGNISIVGAGVIGLTTAILAQRAGYVVDLYSDKPINLTTSMKAGASFKPYDVAYTDTTHEMLQLAWEHFARFERDHTQGGVRKHHHWEASSKPKEHTRHLEVMEKFEEAVYPHVPGNYAHGWRYYTFFIDPPVFLPYLFNLFTHSGGTFHLLEHPFTDLQQLAALPSDTIINCTGLGARDLCRDASMIPIKGEIVVVPAQPEMDWSISADGFYIYPRKNETVLGGTAEWGVENKVTDPGASDLILRGNMRVLPHLSSEVILRTYAGVRPYREGSIRLEPEMVDGKQIIHNYGHGGAGITLSWGSAELALRLL